MKTNKPATVIITVDNILFNTDYYLYLYLMENVSAFSKYITVANLLSIKEFYSRNNANFLTNLFSDKYKSDKRAYVDVGYNLGLLMKNINIYDDNEPTSFAKGTILNPYYIDNPQVSVIYIVIPSGQEEHIKSTIRRLTGNHSKIKYIVDDGTKQLHDLIKDINWDLLVTDNYKQIKYIAENDNIDGKEFLSPKIGYASLERKVKILIDEKGGTFSQYVPE